MSAKLHPYGGEQRMAGNDTPAYVYRALQILERLGLSPKSDPWRAAALCICESILLLLPGLAMGFHLGNLRYSAVFLFGSIASCCQFVYIPLMVRAAPDLSPWLHIPRHGSWRDCFDRLKENLIVGSFWMALWDNNQSSTQLNCACTGSEKSKADGRRKPRSQKQIEACKRNFNTRKPLELRINELDLRLRHLQSLFLSLLRRSI